MSSFLIILVPTAAILHATWNALVKSGGVPEFTIAAYKVTSGFICAFLAFFVPPPAIESWPALATSVFVHTLYYYSLARAYRAGDLSFVYPLFRGMAPILVAVGAAVFADELLSPGTLLGLGMISLGLMSLTLLGPQKNTISKAALKWGIITSVLIAIYTVVDGIGVRASENSLGYIVWLFLFEGIPIGLWLLFTQRVQWFAYMRQSVPNIVFGAIASGTAYGLVIFAMSLGAIAVVSSLRETSVIFAALIGTLFLGESFGRHRIVAACLVAAGIITMRLLP